LKILEVNSSINKKWDEYVGQSKITTFFHLAGWADALRTVFKLRSRSIYAEDEGKIVGICPLFIVKNFIRPCRLVSVPIGVYGGIVADDIKVSEALHLKNHEIAKELSAGSIEYRFKERSSGLTERNMLNSNTHVTFIKPLPSNKSECLAQIPRKARADIRKAIEKGLELKENDRYLKKCYEIYVENQRNLGSPVFSYKWFEALKAIFNDKCRVHLVLLGSKPIAGVLSFIFKDQILPFYGASLRSHRLYHPDGFMYYALQEWAIDRGFKWFDFGRSRVDAGTYDFKQNQGFKPQPLNYQLELLISGGMDQSPSDFKISKYAALASNIWKKLPLCITNKVGPFLYPYVLP